ncbi:MAG: ComEC/Rec2 family competence protein [Eubacterium sp.]|jgi:competence protein ComEC
MRRPLFAVAVFLALGIVSSYSLLEKRSVLGVLLLISAGVSACELCGLSRRYFAAAVFGAAVFAFSFYSYSAALAATSDAALATTSDAAFATTPDDAFDAVSDAAFAATSDAALATTSDDVFDAASDAALAATSDAALAAASDLISGDACHGGNNSVKISGRADEVHRDGEKISIVVHTDKASILVTYFGDIKPEDIAGRNVTVCGDISEPARRRNPRCFDYRLFLRSRGIALVMYADSIEADGHPCGLRGMTAALSTGAREGFAQAISEISGEDGASLARAVLFGEEEYLSDETLQAYRSNGTAHVLAVSGLHVGIIYGAWKKLKKKLRFRGGDFVFAAFLLFYCACASWTPSVVRAAAAVLISAAADRRCRRFDMASALSAVLTVSCAVRPYSLFSPSLQMSYIAVMSMTFLTSHFTKVFGRYVSAALPVQISAAAYCAFAYGTLPVAGLLANIPVLFLISMYVPAGAACFAVFLLTRRVPEAGAYFMYFTGSACNAVNKAAFAGGLIEVTTAQMTLPLLIFFGTAAAFASCEWTWIHLIARAEKRKAIGALLIVALVTAFAAEIDRTPFDRAEAVFVDVGQGDCLHLKLSGRTDVLIDGGGSVRRNVGKNTLRAYLLANGTSDVDLALATHLHTDHFKGIEELAECFSVDAVRTSWTKGDVIRFGDGSKIEILWPLAENRESGDENYYSVVYKAEISGVSILVTGDITEEGEKAIVKEYEGTDKLKCDILKVSHHGSRYSSCGEFLDAVSPAAAVICVGRNSYGHPAPSVIEKLSKKGIIVFRTDEDGAVGIIHEEDGFAICGETTGTITKFS